MRKLKFDRDYLKKVLIISSVLAFSAIVVAVTIALMLF